MDLKEKTKQKKKKIFNATWSRKHKIKLKEYALCFAESLFLAPFLLSFVLFHNLSILSAYLHTLALFHLRAAEGTAVRRIFNVIIELLFFDPSHRALHFPPLR